MGIAERGLSLMHFDSEGSGIDFRDQLPCFDRRVEIRVDGDNWTRVVGTYLHNDHGIDGAGRCNGTDDRTAIHLRRDVSRRPLRSFIHQTATPAAISSKAPIGHSHLTRGKII